MKAAIKAILLIFFIFSTMDAGIVNTRHNLSVMPGNPGTIKAVSETRICVFCHIPHSSQSAGTPLWNRSMPDSGYTLYDSDYLRRMGYPETPANLGSINGTPGSLSRQCLSCHDGTVATSAIGHVGMINGVLNPPDIEMTGDVNPDGTMLSTAMGYFGTDLSSHHPVGMEYDETLTITFGDLSVKGMELKATPDAPIKLYEYSLYPGKKYVECSSCHDPHTENTKFLHVNSGANHAENVRNTCTSCHTKDGWSGSVHESPPLPAEKLYSDVTVMDAYGTYEMASFGCSNCHLPHKGEGSPLLRKVEQNTCFQGAAGTTDTAPCHGVGGAKDVESVLSRSYTHPVNAIDGVHTGLDVLFGTGVTRDPVDSNGIAWSDSKHAVCMDCHNPHQAQPGTHAGDSLWYPETVSSNAVSGPLTGVPGVEPTWPSIWSQPTSFETKKAAEKEYQICMKCHSYWGLGAASFGINTSNFYSPSDPSGTLMTDQAWELNPNNKSGHPVVVASSLRDGSYSPRELAPEQLKAPWNNTAYVGLQTMYCSDCHGSDSELVGDPRGPHGSDLKFLLKGNNNFWPLKPDGVTLFTMDDIDGATGEVPDLFCNNCHDLRYPHTEWLNKMANKGFVCVNCHVAVPHGSSVSRMIGYYNWPAPYNYNGNSLRMIGYRKTGTVALPDVDPKDVYADSSTGYNDCDGATCHRTNDELDNGGMPYDDNLYP